MTAKMNPEAKEKIVAALRSGKYTKGEGHLYDGTCHCVWGVICDVSGISGWKHNGVTFEYDGSGGFPPSSVREWAGFDSSANSIVEIDGEISSIMNHNDAGSHVTFAQLADAIEEQL